jgi:hypothetical protein
MNPFNAPLPTEQEIQSVTSQLREKINYLFDECELTEIDALKYIVLNNALCDFLKID